MDKIEKIIGSLHSDKVLGLDGFPAFFFQQFWPIIKKEVILAIHHFFLHNEMPASWKNTYIALIPKISNPRTVNDYRPISLYNTIYKIIAKLLVNGMKVLMPMLESKE